jgi:hypothetical protein
MRRLAIGWFLCFFLLAPGANAQPNSIHDQIQDVYSFQPHLLTRLEKEKKSAILDKFWNQAKAQPTAFIAGLRQELADFANPPFFLYDGSMLLLSLSDTHEDRKIALAAMAHCDIKDIETKEYFYQVHRMANMGEDTTAAALHVLDDPDFKVYVPEHALTLGQDYVLAFLLLPIDEHIWEQEAISRLATEQEETAQKSLLLLLWYAQDADADKAIAAYAANAGKPDANLKIAKEFVKRGKMRTKVLGEFGSLGTSEASLRTKRRERMQSVSDEALHDLDKYTLAINAKRK